MPVGTPGTIYTCPPNTTALVTGRFVNSSATQDATLDVQGKGDADANARYLEPVNLQIQSKQAYKMGGLMLAGGDEVRVGASIDAIDYWLNVVERPE